MYNGATGVLLGCSYTFLGCKFLSSIFPLFSHPTGISKVISLHRWNNQANNKALLPHSKKNIWNEVNIFFHQSQQTLIRLNSIVLFLVTLFISIFNFYVLLQVMHTTANIRYRLLYVSDTWIYMTTLLTMVQTLTYRTHLVTLPYIWP